VPRVLEGHKRDQAGTHAQASTAHARWFRSNYALPSLRRWINPRQVDVSQCHPDALAKLVRSRAASIDLSVSDSLLFAAQGGLRQPSTCTNWFGYWFM
jgi:hypothetical protein